MTFNTTPSESENDTTFEKALLSFFKPKELILIQKKHIFIAGAGGLGSNIALALVRSGFKKFWILDQDVIEPSNLNRQAYTVQDIGRIKVEALLDKMLAINPNVQIEIFHQTWTAKTPPLLPKNIDFVIEAFDKPEIKQSFVEWASPLFPEVISGNGMAGITGEAVTRVHYVGNISFIGDGFSDINGGLPPLAPRILQCAGKMAEIVLSKTLNPFS